VIQKYVSRPLLFQGKKFHFRCYSLLRADMSALLYQNAFILTAGYAYHPSADGTAAGDAVDAMDVHKLVTNLSVNKRIAGYPGQLPCHVPTEYPELHDRICLMWKSVALAVRPFMQKQKCRDHFEFYGIDVVADEQGRCWLLEVNRLPGLESSLLNKEAEDCMYDTMMASLIRIVSKPLRDKLCRSRNSSGGGGGPGTGTGLQEQGACVDYGLWEVVHAPTPADQQSLAAGLAKIHAAAREEVPAEGGDAAVYGGDTLSNIFGWRAFTKRRENREAVVLGAQPAAAATNTPAPAAPAGASTPASDSGISSAANKRQCGVSGCGAAAHLQCSKCKLVSYCSAGHQKEHWLAHKNSCKAQEVAGGASTAAAARALASLPPQPKPAPAAAAAAAPAAPTGESRNSRCMFCGESIVMHREEDAHEHMRTCPALQEQLNGKDQFTIPKVLRDKGVTLADVQKRAAEEKNAKTGDAT